MFVCYLGQSLDIRDISGRVANAFAVDGPGVFVDQFFDGRRMITCRETGINAAFSKDVLKQSVSGAVELGQGNNVISHLGDVDDGILDGGHPRTHAQGGHAPFKGGNALFENSVCGISDPGVDAARHFQVEKSRSMLGAIELEGNRLIDRDSDGVSRWVTIEPFVNCDRFAFHARRDLSVRS